MPAFKRLGPDDQIDNVLVLHPAYDLVSGSQGWRGSPEGSASLSLYGGARRRSGVFQAIQYQSHAPNVSQTGNPTLGQPLTASVSFAYVTNEPLGLGQVTRTRWGEEHWHVLGRLFDDYRAVSPEYVTASYDYYCLYLNRDSRNVVVDNLESNGSLTIYPSASFTLESWVKPFQTVSPTNDFTIQSMNNSFLFGITGSNGCLLLSSSAGIIFTSSVGPAVNRWSHVAFSYDSVARVGTFLINQQFAGSVSSPVTSLTPVQPSAFLSVGNQVLDDSQAMAGVSGRQRRAFHGLVGETRFWEGARTPAAISGTAFGRLTGSALAGPLSCLMFSEGPLAGAFGIPAQGFVAGSGALDYASLARGLQGDRVAARLVGFDDRVGPVWHPNDNVAFSPTKVLAGGTVPLASGPPGASWGPVVASNLRQMLVVDVPSAFYGRQVVPGSVRMTCRAFESFGFVRTIVDDGRGGLYLSGSVCSSSVASREEYAGVGWNKVGNVFYGEGLVVIKDPSLLDFGRTDGAALVPTDTFALSFRGDSRVPVKTIMCRVDHGEYNCTSNPTFSVTGSAGELLRRHPSGSLRVSTVGIYNSDRELVAVARLADPVRIRARDRINIKLRFDF